MVEQNVIAGQNLLFLNVLVGVVLFFTVAFILKAFVLNKYFYIWLYRTFRNLNTKNTDLLAQLAEVVEQLEDKGYIVQYSVSHAVKPTVKPETIDRPVRTVTQPQV